MAYFPSTVSYPSILGELYSAAFSAPAFNWICSPACTELETIVMDWLAQALALPPCFLSTSPTKGGGVIQVSASDTMATVMVVARERRVRELALAEGYTEGTRAYEDRTMDLRPRLVALGSDQTHSSTAKGATVAGTRYRAAPARLADNLELTGAGLRAVLEECARDGLVPYYLTVTMGTTSTCAVDRVDEVQRVLAERDEWRRGVWVHVDAAYAGAALVCEEYQGFSSRGLALVDSFTMNMHKWLLVNFDANCLFVRDRRDLVRALDVTPAYLRTAVSDAGQVIDYRNWGISLGRRFRALKIWFVLRSYGLVGLRAHIRRTVALGEGFARLVRSRADLFEIVTRPAFCLTVLRVLLPRAWTRSRSQDTGEVDGGDGEANEANEVTKQVYERINARGEVFLTSSVVAGIYAIRVVSANTAADEAHLTRAFEILVATAEEVLQERQS